MSENRQGNDDAARPGDIVRQEPQGLSRPGDATRHEPKARPEQHEPQPRPEQHHGEQHHGERPRPEYGEYATPQDQANAIAKASPPVSPLLTPADRPAAVTPAAPAARKITPAARTAAPAATTGATVPGPSRARRRWDLVLSIGLLSYGLLTVFGGFVQYSDIPAIINEAYAAQRIGEFTSIAQAETVGTTIMLANVSVYAITAFFTLRLLRARRLAFYVPLIGGAVAAAISVILILTLVINDPAFREFIASVT